MQKKRKRIQDQARPNSAARGYGYRWRQYRRGWLAANPMCACGCERAASEVDHIEPVTGPADVLFWDPDNHQSLTHECHSRKTLQELTQKPAKVKIK